MSEKILISAFKRWHSRFLRQAMRILPSEEDAKDALQDAFIKLWSKAGNIETEQSAMAMTSITLRNISIDRYRANKHSNLVDIEEYEKAEDLEPEYELTEEKIKIVTSIMKRCLTESQAKIIRMRDYESKSYDEIAEALNLKPTAVRMQLSRARKTIREEYRRLKE